MTLLCPHLKQNNRRGCGHFWKRCPDSRQFQHCGAVEDVFVVIETAVGCWVAVVETRVAEGVNFRDSVLTEAT